MLLKDIADNTYSTIQELDIEPGVFTKIQMLQHLYKPFTLQHKVD